MKAHSLPGTVIVLLALLTLAILPGQSSRASAVLPAHPANPPAVLSDPADWPMYGHDYQRTNYNPAETLLSPSNVSQMVERWSAAIGTNGDDPSSAPSVSNGVVYVGSSNGTGDNFYAFNSTNGTPIWHENIGYRSSCFNVGLGSTPAISGTQVVMGADNTQNNPAYYGFNTANGATLWTNPMGVGTSGFPWESPLLYNGRAYVGMSSRCDNPSVRGELRAVDMTNGNTVNSAFFVGPGERGGGIWNSPALTPDGSIIAVGTGEDYQCSNCSLTRSMVTMDSNTLAILQHYQEPVPNQDDDFGTSAIIFHDSQGRTLVAAGHKNDNFYAYDVANVNNGPIWTKNTGTRVGMMPAYDPSFGSGGTLFIAGSSSLYAVDPATGNNRWSPVSLGNVYGNMAIANGMVFTVENGNLDVRLESNGSIITTLQTNHPGGENTGPTVSNGFVYWLSGSYVNAWSLPSTFTPSPTTTALTNTPTRTPTSAPTNTPTSTPTNTPTRTNTPQPTNTTAPTQTPGGPTATPIPTNTSTPTPLPTDTSTRTRTPTSTPTTPPTQTPGGPTATPVPSNTSTRTPTSTPTTPPTQTPGGPTATPAPSNTSGPTSTPAQPTATPTACTLTFSDVPVGSTFYPYIRCLACLGIINGYPNGTFRPNNDVTRGQLSKIVSNSAGFNDPQTAQMFQDVPVGSTFFVYIGRLASRGYINGYPCGGPGEPCVPPDNLFYFRPNNNATRGQISKIVSNAAGFNDTPTGQQFQDVPPGSTYYPYIYRLATRNVMQGYLCGGPGEPCVPPDNLPYFRPNNNATRGQTSKIVSNTFFPDCNPPVR
jgi:outer membrane protein assembly factor BamB